MTKAPKPHPGGARAGAGRRKGRKKGQITLQIKNEHLAKLEQDAGLLSANKYASKLLGDLLDK